MDTITNEPHVAVHLGNRALLSPTDVERDYGIPRNTQAVWRCTNRYDFAGLVIKVGASVRYRRDELEAWFESRRPSTGNCD
jgi:hypothetical protein